MLNPDEYYSRRTFLRRLTLTGAAGIAASLVAGEGCTRASDPVATPSPQYLPAGKDTDFTEGDFKKVTLSNGKNFYITKTSDTKYLALSSVCTHNGCEVLWVPTHKQFRCPCHGGKYDAKGKVISGPPPSPLPSAETRVQNGQVQVLA